MAKEETKLPEAIEAAIETLREHLEECNDIGEACAIQEALDDLSTEYDAKSDELADDEAEAELG